jgi:hypothetical protein
MSVVVNSEAVMRLRGCMCGGILAFCASLYRLSNECVCVMKRGLAEASLVLRPISGCAKLEEGGEVSHQAN